jgi:tRNA (cmo5U34)-methyltransferase
MLKLAAKTLGPLASRVRFTNGLIDDVSSEPFDAATSLLTLPFLDAAERLRTATEVHRRPKPGAPFVVAHFSVPHNSVEEGERWLSRSESR